MSFTPELAMKLYEKIEANNRSLEELKQEFSKHIKESNQVGAQYNTPGAENILLDMERISAQIEVDYRRLEVETSWAPEVA